MIRHMQMQRRGISARRLSIEIYNKNTQEYKGTKSYGLAEIEMNLVMILRSHSTIKFTVIVMQKQHDEGLTTPTLFHSLCENRNGYS